MQVLGDSVVTIVSVDRKKVPNGLHASLPATTTGTEASPEDADTEAVTDGETTITVPRATASVQDDRKEYVINKLVGHRRAKLGMQYRTLVVWLRQFGKHIRARRVPTAALH